MIKNKCGILVCLLVTLLVADLTAQRRDDKLRVMVLTDIEADPDDSQSLVRFLTYSNEWDIEGLVATTSIHQKDMVAPESIHDIIDAYGDSFENLIKHANGYPKMEELHKKVKKGVPFYGMDGVGKNFDSEGSDWIITCLEKSDDRPLWVCVWGGTNVLAQALWKMKQTKTTKELSALIAKLRIYTISDQDDAGPWLRKTFPDLFFICSPGYTYGDATWVGIAGKLPGSNVEVVSDQWLADNIQQGHGALGAKYPDVAYIMEGDTPSFLYLIPNGLGSTENPDFGSWGGRYEYDTPALHSETTWRKDWPITKKETRPLWANAEDSVCLKEKDSYIKSAQATIWRWREAFQNDFAARMDWTVKSVEEANHPPVPALAHDENIEVMSGEKFYLNASGTTDPDGDSLSYYWFHYPEAGTYKKNISFAPYAQNMYRVPFIAPNVTKAETIHFILSVTDKGTPALTRYKRVIATVLPQ